MCSHDQLRLNRKFYKIKLSQLMQRKYTCGENQTYNTCLQFGQCAGAALKEFPDNPDDRVCIAAGGVVPHQSHAPHFPSSGTQTPGDVNCIPAGTAREASHQRTHYSQQGLSVAPCSLKAHPHLMCTHCPHSRLTPLTRNAHYVWMLRSGQVKNVLKRMECTFKL